jgi:hypothetical protein
VLQKISRNFEDALKEKMNELLDGLKNEIRQQLGAFLLVIGQKETEAIQIEKGLRKDLKESLPVQIESIRRHMRDSKKDLESLEYRHQGLLAQESKVNLDKLRAHGTDLKGRLAQVQSIYLEAMEQTVREMVQTQSEMLEKRVNHLQAMHEKAVPQLQVNMDFLERVPVAFTESCRQVSSLQVGLHDSAIRNLASACLSEIVSLSRENEDKMVVIRANLLLQLRNHQDYFAEQSLKLLRKFEDDARESKPAISHSSVSSEAEKYPEEEEELPTELLNKLREEIGKISRDLVPAAETEMEQGFSELRSRLNSGTQNACTMIESSFHDCRKKVTELSKRHKEELEELSQRGNALEQLLEETCEILEL